MGPPAALVMALQQHFKIQRFVESGTYRGDTAAWAAENFASVITMELSAEYSRRARERFRFEPRIKVEEGDSGEIIRALAPALTEPVLFWLDAHWSGLDTAGSEAECPLVQEVLAINAATVEHVILVDDARLFCAPPPHPHRANAWPDLTATVQLLNMNGRRHVAIFEDVFVAVPAGSRAFLDPWMQAAATVKRQAQAGRKLWRLFGR